MKKYDVPKSKTNPKEVFVKEKIVTREMDVDYYGDKDLGIESIFNFTCTPIKVPYGDVSFTTSFDHNPDYTSTFLMTAQEALNLGKMLIDSAYDSLSIKKTIEESESYDARLSFLVLKGLIDTIRIHRSYDKLQNYETPYYKYTVTAYKDDKVILSYSTVYNLSYFTSEKEIQYWKDVLTDKGRVTLYTNNWDPVEELKERQQTQINRAFKEMEYIKKPTPIKRDNE